MYMVFSLYFATLSVFTSIPAQLGMVNLFMGCAGFTNLINVGIYLKTRQYYKTFCLNIEWDIDLEEFVVKQPKNTMGGVVEKRIKPDNFR